MNVFAGITQIGTTNPVHDNTRANIGCLNLVFSAVMETEGMYVEYYPKDKNYKIPDNSILFSFVPLHDYRPEIKSCAFTVDIYKTISPDERDCLSKWR